LIPAQMPMRLVGVVTDLRKAVNRFGPVSAMEEVIRACSLSLIGGDNMNGVFIGVVQSAQLARFGGKGPLYGLVTVEADDKSLLQVKIDAYTEGDAFKVGDRVELEIAPLGQTKILVAKKLHRVLSEMEPLPVSSAVQAVPA